LSSCTINGFSRRAQFHEWMNEWNTDLQNRMNRHHLKCIDSVFFSGNILDFHQYVYNLLIILCNQLIHYPIYIYVYAEFRTDLHNLNHTWIPWCPKSHNLLNNYTIQVEVCLIRKANIIERYLIILSPVSKCHSLMSVLNCKFRHHVILYGYKFKLLFNICYTDSLDIPSCAAAFLIYLRGLLCSTTLTASMFSRECIDEGQRCFLTNTKPSLLNWL
jgi:hypothetical protein